MVLVTACGRGEAGEAPAVTSAEVFRQDLRVTAEATGQIEPIRKVEVKSQASGEILRIHVDTGDEVAAGALLAEVEPRDVLNAFNQAQADLEVARARLDIARSQLQRSRTLLESGVITEQENEARVLEHANAQAVHVRAETNLELARLRLGDVTIRAPLAGTILEKNVEEGQVIQSASGSVSGGTTLLVMAALDRMQVRTLVDETDMGQIQAGMTAGVRVEAFPDRSFTGVVEKIEPQAVVQQNVTMFPVIVTLDNRDNLLKPGMNAEVQVLVSQRPNALLIPNNAVVNVQEAGPAAMVLGLDPESVRMDRSALASPQSGSGEGASSSVPAAGGAPGADSLRAMVSRGEIGQDSARALAMAAARARGGVAGARAPGAGPAATSAPGAGRPAMAFVVQADGTIQPRTILIGVNDWDHTEVLAGLEEGERVAIIGAAQLQAQRDEWLNRIRSRQSMFPGGGR